jgi:hypothetical protein
MTTTPPASAGCLPRAALAALAVCAAYGAASMALSLLNKALLGSYAFRGYFFLLGCQMLFSLLVCVGSRDAAGNPFRVPAFSWPLLRAGALMGCLYVDNVLAGMVGLKLVSVPLFLHPAAHARVHPRARLRAVPQDGGRQHAAGHRHQRGGHHRGGVLAVGGRGGVPRDAH